MNTFTTLKKHLGSIVLPAIIFSVNILIGISFEHYGDFYYMIGNIWSIAKSVIKISIYTILFSILLYIIFRKMDSVCMSKNGWFTQRTILCGGFVVLIMSYMPYLYAYYPGSVNADSVGQLAAFFGYIENTNHHPFLSTFLMGVCMKIGMTVRHDTFGIFLYVALQTVILSFAFANSLRIMVKWRTPFWMILATGIYYMVIPFWGGYAQLVIKDTLYTAVVVLFVTQFMDILIESRTVSVNKWKITALVLTGIFASLLRNNGIYMVVPSLAMSIFFVKKGRDRRTMCGALAVCIGLYWMWGNIVLPAFNIADGSVKEALSVPFQQTARYIGEYPDEVSKEEREAIDAILEYDEISKSYVGYVSDFVKNTYKEPTREKLLNYFKHWFLMFFKHPLVYLEATVANSYYYYCANINGSFEPVYVNFIHYDDHTSHFELKQREKSFWLREKIDQFVEDFRNVPVIRVLFSQGFYTYILMGLIGYMHYRERRKYVLGLLPSMIGLLVCIASPVNGSYRYFLPVIACTCICIAYCIRCKDM